MAINFNIQSFASFAPQTGFFTGPVGGQQVSPQQNVGQLLNTLQSALAGLTQMNQGWANFGGPTFATQQVFAQAHSPFGSVGIMNSLAQHVGVNTQNFGSQSFGASGYGNPLGMMQSVAQQAGVRLPSFPNGNFNNSMYSNPTSYMNSLASSIGVALPKFPAATYSFNAFGGFGGGGGFF